MSRAAPSRTNGQPVAPTLDVGALLRAAPAEPDPAPYPGPLVAVTGAGGTGASTVARAVASRFAARRVTLLADLCLDAEQGLFHALPRGLLGIGELVDACRTGAAPDPRPFTACAAGRRYRVLPGIDRRCEWTTLRPRAFALALDALLASHDLVVADVDPDVEGEATTGSIDVEERNVMARSAIAAAAVVLVVAGPGPKGARSAGRVAGDLVAFGVEPARIIIVDGARPAQAAARVADRDLAPPLRPAATRVTPGALGL